MAGFTVTVRPILDADGLTARMGLPLGPFAASTLAEAMKEALTPAELLLDRGGADVIAIDVSVVVER
jgi:hypothetical protein